MPDKCQWVIKSIKVFLSFLFSRKLGFLELSRMWIIFSFGKPTSECYVKLIAFMGKLLDPYVVKVSILRSRRTSRPFTCRSVQLFCHSGNMWFLWRPSDVGKSSFACFYANIYAFGFCLDFELDLTIVCLKLTTKMLKRSSLIFI